MSYLGTCHVHQYGKVGKMVTLTLGKLIIVVYHFASIRCPVTNQ